MQKLMLVALLAVFFIIGVVTPVQAQEKSCGNLGTHNYCGSRGGCPSGSICTVPWWSSTGTCTPDTATCGNRDETSEYNCGNAWTNNWCGARGGCDDGYICNSSGNGKCVESDVCINVDTSAGKQCGSGRTITQGPDFMCGPDKGGCKAGYYCIAKPGEDPSYGCVLQASCPATSQPPPDTRCGTIVNTVALGTSCALSDGNTIGLSDSGAVACSAQTVGSKCCVSTTACAAVPPPPPKNLLCGEVTTSVNDVCPAVCNGGRFTPFTDGSHYCCGWIKDGFCSNQPPGGAGGCGNVSNSDATCQMDDTRILNIGLTNICQPGGTRCCETSPQCATDPGRGGGGGGGGGTTNRCGTKITANKCQLGDGTVITIGTHGAVACSNIANKCCEQADASCAAAPPPDSDSGDGGGGDDKETALTSIFDGPSSADFAALNPLALFGTADVTRQLSSPGGIISRILLFAFPLAGLILFFMLVWAGFEMVTGAAQQGSKAMDSGKQRATNAIIGFVLLFVGYWVMQVIEVIFGITIF